MGETEPVIKFNRISRKDDEGLYSPRIHSSRIRELYKISQQLDLPLTIIVDRALEAYINLMNQPENDGTPNQ